MWVLGTKPWFSARTIHTLNHWAISLSTAFVLDEAMSLFLGQCVVIFTTFFLNSWKPQLLIYIETKACLISNRSYLLATDVLRNLTKLRMYIEIMKNNPPSFKCYFSEKRFFSFVWFFFVMKYMLFRTAKWNHLCFTVFYGSHIFV